jgi:SAM-dependent methyltransferase
MTPSSTLQLAPWSTAFAPREGVVLYHDLTGRTLRLTGEAAQAWAALRDGAPIHSQPSAIIAALEAAGFLCEPGENPWPRVAPRYPVRARWATFAVPGDAQPDTLVMAREAGTDQPWAPTALSPLEALIWQACDGQHTVHALIQSVHHHHGPEAAHEAVEILLDWCSGRYQLIKLLDGPLSAEPPTRFFSWVHDLPLAHSAHGTGAVDLADYHRQTITDASEQFEERETTLSHLLRYPTPVLSGRTWGAAVVDALTARGALPHGARVLEVGGGTGWLAQRALERRPDLCWTIVDLAPALQRAQRARLTALGVRFVRGDAQRLPIATGSVHVVLSNEVIADLPAEWVQPDAPPAIVDRLGVTPSAPRVTNIGALHFIGEIHRVLRPGGFAWLSEYGEIHGAPVEAVHLDHPEVGIEFGVLARAAENLGLSAEITEAITELQLQPTPVLASPPGQFGAICALIRHLGGPAPDKRAWTREALAEAIAPVPLGRLKHLAFVPATERCMTFPPERIRVLVLRA